MTDEFEQIAQIKLTKPRGFVTNIEYAYLATNPKNPLYQYPGIYVTTVTDPEQEVLLPAWNASIDLRATLDIRASVLKVRAGSNEWRMPITYAEGEDWGTIHNWPRGIEPYNYTHVRIR